MKILEEVITHIKKKLNKEKISFLDSSCGDMNWMPGEMILLASLF